MMASDELKPFCENPCRPAGGCVICEKLNPQVIISQISLMDTDYLMSKGEA